MPVFGEDAKRAYPHFTQVSALSSGSATPPRPLLDGSPCPRQNPRGPGGVQAEEPVPAPELEGSPCPRPSPRRNAGVQTGFRRNLSLTRPEGDGP